MSQIETDLKEIHGDSAPALVTIYYWLNEFKRGHTSATSATRLEVVSFEKMLDKIHGIVIKDREFSIVRLLRGVHIILQEFLKIKNLKAHTRKDISKSSYNFYRSDDL